MVLAELIKPFNPQKEIVVYREHICPSGYITYIPERKERTNEKIGRKNRTRKSNHR